MLGKVGEKRNSLWDKYNIKVSAVIQVLSFKVISLDT